MSNSPSLSPAQTARARQHTYALLGRLYAHGLTAGLRDYVREIPALAARVPRPFQPDEAAAVHHHLFSLNVFPYESIFVDSSGLLGGPVTEAVSRSYAAAGYHIRSDGDSADHIAHELGLLAFLCAAEADAHEDALPSVARQLLQRQRQFLDAHLLRWLFPFTIALTRQSSPFYAALATLTQEFGSAHAADLPSLASPAFSLPPVPDLLADEKTGLREIAHYLVTPPDSGWYLGRDDIGRLGRAHALPRGFGSREQLLVNLLRAAAQYESILPLLESLIDTLAKWDAAYAAGCTHAAHCSAFITPWQTRLAQTRALLEQMRAEAHTRPA